MKFTSTHEWVDIDEKGIAFVGISEHARSELGEIVYVQLPAIGTKVKAGEEICVLESTKAAADIYAPVSGTIVEVNHFLQESCSFLNESPEEKGWLFKILLDDPTEASRLMDACEYEELLK